MDLKASIKIARKFNWEFHQIVTAEERSDECVYGAILGLACSLVDLTFDEVCNDEDALHHISEAINAAVKSRKLRDE